MSLGLPSGTFPKDGRPTARVPEFPGVRLFVLVFFLIPGRGGRILFLAKEFRDQRH